MMAHVSMITLGVSDVSRATRFYEAMGWRRSTASVDDVVAFMTGGAVVLGLFGRQDLATDAGIASAPPGAPTSVALAMNLADEQTVDQALARASQAGATVTKLAERTEWGGYSGYFTDPDHHLWEVAHNPGFELLPDGRVQLPDAP